MSFIHRLAVVILGMLGALPTPAPAEDTDLFMANPAGGASPNVLIILDNTANWGPVYPQEKAALQSVLAQLTGGNYNIGLMTFTETGSPNDNTIGGYVRSAIMEMTPTNRALLSSRVQCLKDKNKENVGTPTPACQWETQDKGNAANYAMTMYEAYLYFKGRNAYAGRYKEKRDPTAFQDATSQRYLAPGAGSSCARKQVIFISNGPPDNRENNGTALEKLKKPNDDNNVSGWLSSDPIKIANNNGLQENWADEFARFMAKPGNDIHTYTIDVVPDEHNRSQANTALLQSMAYQGQGTYYSVAGGVGLQAAIEAALNEILAINSVYASIALPVSVNVRGTFLNEVYMAEFRPDAATHPRWWGNLKLYQLALDPVSDALRLADARTPPQPAQNPITGFISSDVVSFWTHASTYWDYSPDGARGTPPSVSDVPDGEVVEKGGSGQVARTAWPTRNLYTCTGACGGNSLLSATPFTSANTGLSTAVIDWVRGADNTATTERDAAAVRPSLHGDVVHSRPAVVNYNRPGTTSDIVVFFGANDGILRAVKGGKTVTGAGGELWGFVAPEFFGKLQRLRDNSPNINVPAVMPYTGTITYVNYRAQYRYTANDTAENKPYFVDGNITVYTRDVNGDGRLVAGDGDQVYIYVPMRRGGSFLYALDVSDPSLPRLLWRRSQAAPGYGELGQTWSEPKVAKIRATTAPVLVMGAGYDPLAEDYDPQSDAPPQAATAGRGILVINGETGDVIWQAGPDPSGALQNKVVEEMTNSIAAGVTVIEARNYIDGYADRAYAADTGGNLWRVDLSDADPTNWTVTLFAALGRSSNPPRKFLYPPDLVYAGDANGLYDAVLIGSGDREQPFDTTVTNRFFMVKDRNIGLTVADPYTATIVRTELFNATENLIQGTGADQATAAAALASNKGWYVDLSNGEKVEGGAITIAGTVFFGTHQWTSTIARSCTGDLGIARIYAISYRDATATINFDNSGGLTVTDRSFVVPGGGFLPSPTPVLLQSVPVMRTAETNPGTYQTVCFGPTCVAPPGASSDQVRKLFWYRCIEGEGDSSIGACGN